MLAGLASERPDQESDECDAGQDELDVHHVPRRSVVTRKMHGSEQFVCCAKTFES